MVGNVAVEDRMPVGLPLGNALGVRVQGEEGDVVPLEQHSDRVAHPSVAADQDLGPHPLRADLAALCTFGSPVADPRRAPGDPAAHRSVEPDQYGAADHGEQHRRDDDRNQLAADHAGIHGDHEQGQTKLPAHPEEQPSAPRGDDVLAAPAQESGDDQGLARQHQQSAEDGPNPDGLDRGGIEPHADADEEKPEEHIPEGPDAGLHLMPELGLPEHGSRQEGTESQGQSSAVGAPGREQRHQEHRQVNSSAERPFATARKSGLSSQRPRTATRAMASAALATTSPSTPARSQAPTDNPSTGTITSKGTAVRSWKTENGQPQSTVAAGLFPLLPQLAAEDRGGRLGENRTRHEGGRRRDTGNPEQEGDERGHQDHLGSTQDHDPMPQCVQLRRGVFEPDGEEQEHHSKLR